MKQKSSPKSFKSLPAVVLALAFALFTSAFFLRARAQEEKMNLMSMKLSEMQSALEGLTREDYGMVRTAAAKLDRITEVAQWKKYDDEEYLHFSKRFQASVAGMAEAADEQNLEAATLRFSQVTMSCVECHKLMRDRQN